MGNIILGIVLGGIYILGGCVYLGRLKKEYKTWAPKEEKGEKQ